MYKRKFFNLKIRYHYRWVEHQFAKQKLLKLIYKGKEVFLTIESYKYKQLLKVSVICKMIQTSREWETLYSGGKYKLQNIIPI